MAKFNDPVNENGYSSTVRRILNIDKHSGGAAVTALDQVLTGAYVTTNNIATINCVGYNTIGVYVDFTRNDSENMTLNVLGMLGDTNTYTISGFTEKTVFTNTPDTGRVYYEIDVGTLQAVRLQIKAGVVGATAGVVSVYVDKATR